MMKANYPIVTHNGITWSNEALRKLNVFEEITNMISTLEVTMEGAIQADIKSNLSSSYNLSSYEFFCSDEFVNNSHNQLIIIDYIFKYFIKWNS